MGRDQAGRTLAGLDRARNALELLKLEQSGEIMFE